MAAADAEGPPLSKKWTEKISRQGPWDPTTDPLSYHGAASLPMPVEISDKASLAPFFEFLSGSGRLHSNTGGIVGTEPGQTVKLIEFEKGVAYADGRIDLCKMATGPRNIGDLMDALEGYADGRHFLLGNNIIGPTGAKAIAAFINKTPTRYETWYLAGNCIDGGGLDVLVDAMLQSPVITNIWLKRNPLGPLSATTLARLIIESPALRTLDLDQTSLGDTGVAELFRLLNQHDQPIALRHIYVNATGVGSNAVAQIAEYLKHGQLESLYLSCNPIGEHVLLLAAAVKVSNTVQRLTLQSCGLAGDCTAELLNAVQGHHSLEALDLGQSYATEDLAMRYNWLDGEKFTIALLNLVTASGPSRLRYLNLAYTPMTCASLNEIYSAVINSSHLIWFQALPLIKGGRSKPEIQAGLRSKELIKDVQMRLGQNVAQQYNGTTFEEFEEGPKRFLLSPPDVRYIDSVYRNWDSRLARRGLKGLEKWWTEDDGTRLQKVQDCVVV